MNAVHSPTQNATPKQVQYLQNLRKAIGVQRWNGAKQLLGINVSGTETLSRYDASRLIDVIKYVLEGGQA